MKTKLRVLGENAMSNILRFGPRLLFVLSIVLLLAVTTCPQTPKPTPQPTPRRPLPKLANGARGFTNKGADATSRFIAIGGGYGGGGEERRLPRLRSKSAQGYYQWGEKLYGEAHNKAIAAFEQAIKMNRSFVRAYWRLGEAYSEYNALVEDKESKYSDQQAYQRAIAAFEQVRRLQPGRAGVYNNLGVLYFDTGQYEKAIAAFQTGLKLKRNKDGKNDISILESGVRGNADLYLFIGDAYQSLGKNDLALSSYQLGLRSGESDFTSDVNERLGVVFEKLGDLDQAIAAYLKIDPDVDDEIALRLGLLYARKANFEKAIEYFTKAAGVYEKELVGLNAEAPGEETDRVTRMLWEKDMQRSTAGLTSAKYNLGVAFLSLNQADKAIVAFKEAVEADPTNGEARFNLGIAYLAVGDKKDAAEQVQPLKRINAEMAQELDDLIRG